MKNFEKILNQAPKMSAIEFTNLLDKTGMAWVWDDCDNLSDLNEGRCVIVLLDLSIGVWFEDGAFVEQFKVTF